MQRRFVDNHTGTFRLDPFHDALDRRMAEIIGIGFHGEAVHTDYDFFLPAFLFRGIVFVVSIGPGYFQYLIGNKVLACTVAFPNGFDEMSGNVPVIGQ